MKRIKIGSMCRCTNALDCFFEPGSVVVITGHKSTVHLVRLLFGAVKHDADPDGVRANTENDGSVQCFSYELEVIHEKDT